MKEIANTNCTTQTSSAGVQGTAFLGVKPPIHRALRHGNAYKYTSWLYENDEGVERMSPAFSERTPHSEVGKSPMFEFNFLLIKTQAKYFNNRTSQSTPQAYGVRPFQGSNPPQRGVEADNCHTSIIFQIDRSKSRLYEINWSEEEKRGNSAFSPSEAAVSYCLCYPDIVLLAFQLL